VKIFLPNFYIRVNNDARHIKLDNGFVVPIWENLRFQKKLVRKAVADLQLVAFLSQATICLFATEKVIAFIG
jgi:hypothetical protein